MLLRYILVAVLIGFTFSEAYKIKHPRRREYFKAEPVYGDYDDDDYDYPIYAKDTEADNQRPSIFTYWNNLLKRTRLPSWNITNPFSKLFSPYVIKVDFPPGSDPQDDPQSRPTRTKNKRKKTTEQEDYELVNTYSNNDLDNAQYFYDPVTQQYYEVQQTASQDYNPQNNYYATTFNDDDEIVINLDNANGKDQADDAESASDEQDGVERYLGKVRNVGFAGKYNSPAVRHLKTKRVGLGRTASADQRKPGKRTRKVGTLAFI